MSEPTGVHEFVPFTQRKVHYELKSGDFVRIQGKFFIIDEIRRFKRPFDFLDTDDLQVQLTQLTGSLANRFIHLDKFAVDPEATCAGTEVTVTYRGADITGLQYAHVWTVLNADPDHPHEIDLNSFTKEDILQVTLVYAAGETGETALWFSGEEYTLVEYPGPMTLPDGRKTTGVPNRFVIVAYYGFSRVVTKEEFEEADMAGRMRT